MLWHYTNLESLALILTNRTLRLMPLTGMDDPLESQTRDVANLGRFFFASCWTDDSQESIPMWKMYASLDSGIRIGLPPMPFVKHNYTKNEFSRITGIPIDHISAADTMSSFMPLEDFAKGLLSPAFLEGNGVLQKVHYTDAVDDLVKHATACNDKNVVLLCHDAPGKGTTVQALQRIIDNYRSRGYTFRGISRNSYAPHQPIAN